MKTITNLVVIGVAGLMLGCGHKKTGPPSELPAVRVQLQELREQTVPEIAEVVGTVRPRVAAGVSAKVMAVVEKVNVKDGDIVTAGQVLAELDKRDLQAEFDRAKADYDRFQALLAKQAATRAEFDAVQARYRIAEATLSYATVTAPFAGVVAHKQCDVGELAAPGKPLFTIEQQGAFRLEVPVPDRFAGACAIGQAVPVVVEATGETCGGTVSEIVPASDPASRTFVIKIDLSCQKPLKSGMFGRAKLTVGERNGLFAPLLAVHQQGQLTFVYVTQVGRAQMRLVKLGRSFGDKVELLSGVSAGEQLIAEAAGELADGQRVQ